MVVELIFAGCVAAVAAYAATRSNGRKRALAALHATPRLTSSTPVGAVVVAIGRVRTIEDKELDAPLSGRPCVAYQARVYRAAADEGPGWGTANLTPFLLEREDGTTVVVDAEHVAFLFPPLPLPADAPERCEAFAIELGLSPKLRKKASYEEIIVLEDMRIAVYGRVAETGERPRLTGDAAHPIVIAAPS